MLWENGRLLEQQALDRGLQFGDGHFTTFKVSAGQPLHWPLHWQRLCEANSRLGLTALPKLQIETCIADAATQLTNAIIKVIVTAGAGQRGYGRSFATPSHWYLSATPYQVTTMAPLHVAKARLKLGCQPALAGLKTLNRLEQVLLSQELEQRNTGNASSYDDLLVCDAEDFICEGTKGNLFWYDGTQWCTPELRRAGVAGVTRALILSSQCLGQVNCSDFGWESLECAQRAFLCNSVLGAVPIASLADKVLANPTLPQELEGLCL